MSTKHFFPTTEGVVNLALSSLAARNNHLEFDATNKVVYNKAHSPSKISLVSGGGSGHEPAWSGYVGDGMLAASVSGEVFASPSTKQVMAGIEHVPSNEGLILLITNYTGDQLHFGLAREKAAGAGIRVGTISATDDVALGRKKSQLVGRRGLAANLIGISQVSKPSSSYAHCALVLKLVGAASQEGWKFDDVLSLGRKANDEMVTIGTSLDHCHIPGRTDHHAVPDNTCIMGMGIHNEPGFRTISPMPSAEDLVKEMLKNLLDQNDPDRAFTKFKDGDEVAVMIDNFGGLSTLETEALTQITLTQIEKDWKLKPARSYVGTFETSLNGPGFSISVGNITGVSRSTGHSTSKLFELLDAPTNAPAWPKNGYANVQLPTETINITKVDSKDIDSASVKGPAFNADIFTKALRTACTKANEAEPQITKYDLLMGDGDCGEAVSGACTAILSKLDSGAVTRSGSVFGALDEVASSLEDIGGSLGAILSILVTAFTNSLRDYYRAHSGAPLAVDAFARSLPPAMRNLMNYTGARVGDRTVMDVLIPFSERLAATADLKDAVHAAENAAQKTAAMEPKFGRASYVGDRKEKMESLPPDPGAYAVSVFLKGLLEGLNE